MKLRGPGDFFGVRQSGDFEFKIGDIMNDADTLKKAADAINLIESGELYVSDEEMEMMNTSKISSINI